MILLDFYSQYLIKLNMITLLKGRSRRLRPKAHILEYPLGNPYDVLKVLLGPPYGPYGLGPYKGPLWSYINKEYNI